MSKTKRPITKLNDTQLVILSTATKLERPIGRDDFLGLRAKGIVLTRSVEGLLKRGLLKAVRVKASEAFWQRDEGGRAKGLAITAEGMQAIGIEAIPEAGDGAPESGQPETQPIRAGTKKARLVELLEDDGGVSIAALSETPGWLSHTVRAALTRLRQQGVQIERVREDKVSRYRIVKARKAA